MANLLQLQSGIKFYGSKQIFDEAQFGINEGEHVGVIGPNGAGKTTLFKILTGIENLDSGKLVRAKNLKLGYLAQHDQWTAGETLEDYLQGSVIPIWELKALGRKLGLHEDIYSKPILSLSGGYRMRCKLLYLIGQDPNLMLLDEPTNYLDLETTLVLENFLQGFKGAFMLISHDREFLRRTTDHVLEVEQGEMTKFNGNLDDYFEQKQMLRSQLESRAMSVKEKREKVLDFVSRFGAKATKARQAQSRLKSLDRMEVIELKALPVTATIKIPSPVRTGKQIVSMSDVELGYETRKILSRINFNLLNGDHVAVVGLNGAGKSTFLKALAQRLPPLSGRVELGYQVKIGYYAQHVAEQLDPVNNVIDEMTKLAHPEVTRQNGLDMAGSLLFSGDDIKKKISVLSGGEKSRVALGQILLQKNPCLILDEPTNHLDFQTVEALTQALNRYEGTVVVVSHDRSFIRRIGNKILEVREGQVNLYPGSYDEYVWSLEQGVLAERGTERSHGASGVGSVATEKSQASTADREERKARDKEIRQLEKILDEISKKILSAQSKQNQINEELSQAAPKDLLARSREFAELQDSITDLEQKWLLAAEKLEDCKKP